LQVRGKRDGEPVRQSHLHVFCRFNPEDFKSIRGFFLKSSDACPAIFF
jgi:hypothetical protein